MCQPPPTSFTIDNNKCKHIRVISEGSCDTEDWSNDAENTALITGINYILTYIHIEISHFEIVIIFLNLTVFPVFLIK